MLVRISSPSCADGTDSSRRPYLLVQTKTIDLDSGDHEWIRDIAMALITCLSSRSSRRIPKLLISRKADVLCGQKKRKRRKDATNDGEDGDEEEEKRWEGWVVDDWSDVKSRCAVVRSRFSNPIPSLLFRGSQAPAAGSAARPAYPRDSSCLYVNFEDGRPLLLHDRGRAPPVGQGHRAGSPHRDRLALPLARPLLGALRALRPPPPLSTRPPASKQASPFLFAASCPAQRILPPSQRYSS